MMTTANSMCRNENKGFTFIWKIENFSHCTVQKGNSLSSPEFKIVSFKGSWSLSMYSRGKTDSFIECKLSRSYENIYNLIDLLFCVCTVNGEVLFEATKDGLVYNYKSSGNHCIAKFERNVLEALPEDTVVIYCNVQIDTSEIENPMHCFATTRINLQKRVFHWKLDKFSTLQLREQKEFNLSEVKDNNLSLTLTLSLVGRNIEDACVQITINFKNLESKTFSTCAIFVMEENGTARKYMQDEYWLEYGDSVKHFPHFLTRREIIADDPTDDTLLLRGEVTLSGDNNGMELVMYGLQTQEAIVAAASPLSRPSINNSPSALSSDMLALFEGSGPPSDFELIAGGRSFLVHQLVLGVRSAVFRSMFDSDMLERSTRSVELSDLDAGTAERLLKFAYADAEPPAELAWEPLASLYSAADKYQILALRKICARRLVQLLDTANAPRILQLADRHRDSHLKEDAIDFIFKRGRAVLESEHWRNLQRDDVQLVAETLQKIFMEKILIQPLELLNVEE